MFRVVVFNFKNIFKNFIKFIVVILLFIGIKNILNLCSQSISRFDYKKIIDTNIYFGKEDIKEEKYKDILEIAFLKSTKIVSNNIENDDNIENKIEEVKNNESELINHHEHKDNEVNEDLINSETIVENENNEEFKKIETKVVTENNINESYNVMFDTVKIKNESKFTLTDKMLEPNFNISNKDNIIIFHTHTCESYTPTEANSYVASGNFRTIDMNYSVERVGVELTNNLNSKGFKVHHLLDLHDYPAYNGSYSRSYITVNNALKNNSASLVIDLHRDAVGSKSNYAPAVYIGEEKVAQLMFVIGTNGGGLSHNNWNNNLKLAVKIQQKANEMYPRFI